MLARLDNDPELERQRAEVEAAFRERWVPLPGSEPQLLTERDYAKARRFIAQPGKTWVAPVAIEAVRNGAQPGDPLPHDRFWLMEDIDTGALHRMMDNPPPADKDGIVWTTWGDLAGG